MGRENLCGPLPCASFESLELRVLLAAGASDAAGAPPTDDASPLDVMACYADSNGAGAGAYPSLGAQDVLACDLGMQTPSGIVGVQGTEFTLDGGPFFSPGTNTYYLMVYAADVGLRPYVDEVLGEARDMGLKTLRTWAFNDRGWNCLQTAPGVFNEQVFCGLDYVLYKAGECGLRLVLPFVNNWSDYGGMDQYVTWDATYGVDGTVATSHNDFYTDSDTRGWYKNYVATMLNRVNTFTGRTYKDDPTVLAWELANEPRAPGDTTGNILQGWLVEMAAHVKSLDPVHLLTTGLEGFYDQNSGDWMHNGSQGTDFIRNHQIEDIDFATVHLWSDQWGLNYNQSLGWFEQHIQDAHDLLGKPVVLEEFGLRRGAGGSTTARDQLYQGLTDMARVQDVAGWNFWLLLHDDYFPYDDGYGVYSPSDVSTVAIVSAAADEMNGRTSPAEEWLGCVDSRWENAANWSGSFTPGPHTPVVLGSPAAYPPVLSQNQSARGLAFRTAGWSIEGSAFTLTVGVGGVDTEGAGLNSVGPDVILGADSTWTIAAGNTLRVNGAVNGGGRTLTRDGEGTLELSRAQSLAALALDAGTTRLAVGGSGLIVANALSIDASDSVLDLREANLVVDYTGVSSPLAAVATWVRAGLNAAGGGYWDGMGITSSVAAAYPDQLTAVGVLDNTDVEVGGKTEFAGETVDPTSVLARYTWWGDANLDGVVDANDYDVIDKMFLFPPVPDDMGWWTGDFNYDGVIDANDYDRIDRAFLFQAGPLTPPRAMLLPPPGQTIAAPDLAEAGILARAIAADWVDAAAAGEAAADASATDPPADLVTVAAPCGALPAVLGLAAAPEPHRPGWYLPAVADGVARSGDAPGRAEAVLGEEVPDVLALPAIAVLAGV